MQVAVIGTGRCGTSSLARWLPGAEQEVQHHRLCAAMGPWDIFAAISELLPPYVVEPHLGLFLPWSHLVWPDAKYVWVQREREPTVDSMMRWGWYRSHTSPSCSDIWVLTKPQPPDTTWDERRKCEWFYDHYMETCQAGWDQLPPDAKHVFHIEWANNPEACGALARFVDRPDLINIPIPHANRTQ